ncbi:MAG: FAD-dependent oxidoreductase, partial [Actinomycetota bacterium]
MRVAVIGGGAIGLCSARSLAERGHEVILVENGVCGSGASYGNAGWIAPVLSGPVPAPGVVRQGLLWL